MANPFSYEAAYDTYKKEKPETFAIKTGMPAWGREMRKRQYDQTANQRASQEAAIGSLQQFAMGAQAPLAQQYAAGQRDLAGQQVARQAAMAGGGPGATRAAVYGAGSTGATIAQPAISGAADERTQALQQYLGATGQAITGRTGLEKLALDYAKMSQADKYRQQALAAMGAEQRYQNQAAQAGYQGQAASQAMQMGLALANAGGQGLAMYGSQGGGSTDRQMGADEAWRKTQGFFGG